MGREIDGQEKMSQFHFFSFFLSLSFSLSFLSLPFSHFFQWLSISQCHDSSSCPSDTKEQTKKSRLSLSPSLRILVPKESKKEERERRKKKKEERERRRKKSEKSEIKQFDHKMQTRKHFGLNLKLSFKFS